MVSRVKTVFFWTMLYLVFEKFWWGLKPTIPPPGYAPYVGTLWARYSSTVGRLQMLLSVSRLLAFFVSSPSYSRRTYSREGTRDVGTYQTFLSSCATTTLILLFRAMTPNRKKGGGRDFLSEETFCPLRPRWRFQYQHWVWTSPMHHHTSTLCNHTPTKFGYIFRKYPWKQKSIDVNTLILSAFCPKKAWRGGRKQVKPNLDHPPSPFPTCFAPTDRKKNFFFLKEKNTLWPGKGMSVLIPSAGIWAWPKKGVESRRHLFGRHSLLLLLRIPGGSKFRKHRYFLC